jgi:hypothetical protein
MCHPPLEKEKEKKNLAQVRVLGFFFFLIFRSFILFLFSSIASFNIDFLLGFCIDFFFHFFFHFYDLF